METDHKRPTIKRQLNVQKTKKKEQQNTYLHIHTHRLRTYAVFPTYICLWHTTHTQSVVREVNSRHALHTRNLQTRHGAPRFVMRPNSVLQRAQCRFDSQCNNGWWLPMLVPVVVFAVLVVVIVVIVDAIVVVAAILWLFNARCCCWLSCGNGHCGLFCVASSGPPMRKAPFRRSEYNSARKSL